MDASTARNNLGLAIGTNVQAYDVDLGSLASGITGMVKGAGNGGGYSAATAETDYVTPSGTGTLANKTLTTPTIASFANAGHTHTDSAGGGTIAEAALAMTDITTNNATSARHGFLPKLENSGSKYLRDDGTWQTVSGTGGATTFVELTDISVNASTTGPVWWDGDSAAAVKAGAAGTYLKSDGTWDTPSGAGDMAEASYPNIVTLESEPVTNTYMLVADGSQWKSVAPADVRTALGLVIGTNVQAYDADLTTFAGITPSANVQSLLGCADYSAMRTALGLAIGTNVQAYDADLATWAGVTPSANGQSLVAAADYSAMRTLLSLVPGTNVQAYDADLATLAAPTANRIYYSNGSQAQTAVALGAANTVFVGNGTTSAPGFRALGVADLPTITPAIGGTGVANGANNTITFTGNYTLGLTLSNNTAVTLPTTGTLATLAGSEALTNKSVNGVTLSAASDYTLTVPGTGTAALTSNKLSAFAATTSAELAGVISDETGSGALVLATSPTLVTPTIGAATMTSLVQSGQTIGSNIIVTNGFSVDADGDVTGKSFTTPQVAATAGEAVLYAAEATPSGLYTSLKGPASAPSGGAYSFQFTNTLPSAGQSFKFGTVSSRIVPLEYTTYAELSGATFTGAVQLPAVGTSQHSLILPHGTAHSSPTNGEIWTTTSGLYARINGSTVGPFLASGSTTLDGVGNPGDNKSFTMGPYTLGFTSSTATWGGVTISNTAADPSAGALLALGYTADGDTQTVFLDCLDNSSGDSKFKVGQHGILTMPDASAYLALGADPADQGVLRLANATVIAWEDATECTLTHVDNTGLSLNLALAVGGALTVTGNILPGSAGGSDLGTTAAEWRNLYLTDGGILYLGADQDVTLTHVADTGVRLNAAMQLQFRDSAIYIASLNDGYLDIEADTAIRMLGPVDMGVNALDCDSNTVTLSTVSGAIDAGGATSLEIPNSDDPDVDAAGEISWDTDGWMRAYDGSAQVAIARKLEEIHVTVVAPQDLEDAERDAFWIWSNESGMSFIVTGWKAWSKDDDTTLNIEEIDADGANNATVDAVEIATNGTGCFYASDSTITGATIENGHILVLDFDDSDDPDLVKITIYGYYNADVN